MTWKKQKLIFWIIAIPMCILIGWGAAFFTENTEKEINTRKIMPIEKTEKEINTRKITPIEKAELPVKIYKGVYDDKKFIIKEYRPIR